MEQTSKRVTVSTAKKSPITVKLTAAFTSTTVVALFTLMMANGGSRCIDRLQISCMSLIRMLLFRPLANGEAKMETVIATLKNLRYLHLSLHATSLRISALPYLMYMRSYTE